VCLVGRFGSALPPELHLAGRQHTAGGQTGKPRPARAPHGPARVSCGPELSSLTMIRMPGSVGKRTRSRRRYAAAAGATAVVLLVAGFVLAHSGGGVHEIGIICFGYGLGVAVAAVFLALGHEPTRRKK
jgi:hypothetical protein